MPGHVLPTAGASENEWRVIYMKVCCGIITKLLYKRLIQITKHKCKFHDHFSKFPVTAIYEYETRAATRSPWQIIRQFVFVSTWALFVISQPFSIIFSTPRLCLRAALSVRNYPTRLHTQDQIRISANFLPNIPLISTIPVPTNILCLTVLTDL